MRKLIEEFSLIYEYWHLSLHTIGSFALKTYDYNSDIDFLLVSNDRIEWKEFFSNFKEFMFSQNKDANI